MKDPVCNSVVDPHEIEVIYLNQHFAFCSEQCKERFVINPQSYMSKFHPKDPKSLGMQNIKERRWFLDEASILHQQPETIKDNLEAMKGVKWAQVSHDLLTIRYDLMQVTGKNIEEELINGGVRLSQDPFDRMRRSYMHYLEERDLFGCEINCDNNCDEEQKGQL